MSVRTARPARRWRHRLTSTLVGLVAATGLAILPASPAHAIQTIAWVSPPPSSAQLGQTISFSWTGRADTFLGARITGCFVNFPDAPNYQNSFGGNFTTGNCNYQNRVVTTSPTYPIQVGFYLSSGGTMTMSWNVSVASPSPTLVNLPSNNTIDLTATSPGGATVPTWNVYGYDSVYGNYSATCSPAAGTVLPAGTANASCSATNGAGKTTTQPITINVAQGTPVPSWNTASQYPAGTTWGQVMNASVSPSSLTGGWTYVDGNGTPLNANAVIPVGSTGVTAVFTPTGQSASNWRSVSIARTITAVQTTQTVSFQGAPSSKTFGSAPFAVTAVGTSGGGQVAISAQAGSPCTVTSPSGTTTVTATVSLTGTGACTLLADQAATGQYTAAPRASWSVSVGKGATSVSYTSASQITYGTTLTGALNAVGSVPGTMSYTINGTPVSPSTVLDAGTYSILATLTPTDSANWATSSAAITQVVNRAAAGLDVAPIADQVYGEAPVQVAATSSSPAPRTFSSPTPGACSVSGTGLVTTVGSGICSVQVVQAQTSNYNAAIKTVSFAVGKATPTLTWSDPADISYGTALDATQLNAAVGFSGAAGMGSTTYTYGFGVPADGAVLDAGDHTLTATWTPFAVFANRYRVVSETVEIRVDKAAPEIVYADPADVVYGTALGDDQLDASVPGVSGTFAYEVDGAPAAGQVLDAGTHTIIATFTPSASFESNYLAGAQAATIVVTKAPQAITFEPGGQHTYGDAPFDVTATGGDSGRPVTFAAESGSDCTVDGATVTLTGAGSCVLIASQEGNGNYLAAPSVTGSITIDKATPSLDWDAPAPITFGDALGADQLDAAVSPSEATGTIAYFLADGTTPADGAVLHAGDGQSLVATYTPDADGSRNWVPVSRTVTIDVAKAGQAIDFADLGAATYGDGPVEVSATGGGSGEPVTFEVDGPCSLHDGALRIDGAGTCTVTASQAGDADHEAATSVTRQLVVAKATTDLGLGAIDDQVWGAAPIELAIHAGDSTQPVLVQASGDCTVADALVTVTGAGDCSVTASQAGDDNHLAAEPVTRTFSIGKAALTVKAAPATKTYGAVNPGLGWTATGFVNGDSAANVLEAPVCTTTATAASHVGTEAITCSGAVARNYAISYTGGELSITQAPLATIAPVVTRYSGAANPALVPTFSGFVNGDGPSALSSTGTCTTTATASSPVGTYPVTCSGATAQDYDVAGATGSLTVVPGWSLSAFQAPVVDGYTVKRGSTVPVKFQLLDANGNAVSAATVSQIANAGLATIATRSGGVTTQQGAFKATGDWFHANLSTGGLALGSNEVIVTVKAADGSVMATKVFTLVTR